MWWTLICISLSFDNYQLMTNLIFYFFKDLFWCGSFLKSLLNIIFVIVGFSFFFSFGHEACGILAPWPEIEPAASTLEDEVLTIGSPGKSSPLLFMANLIYLFPIDSVCSLLQIICNQIPDVTLVHLSTFQCISLIDKIFFFKREPNHNTIFAPRKY